MADERTNPLQGTRVLVVEDEYYLADDLSRSLREAGAQVVGPASSVEQAQRLASGGGFDCAVVDMNLHGEFAFAFAEKLEGESVPFIVATGYNQQYLPETLKNVPRVGKPYSACEVVEKLIELREQR